MKTYKISNNSSIELREPAINYLNGNRSIMDKVRLIRDGIHYVVFKELRKTVPFTDEEWSVLLDMSLKSLQRYDKEGTHIFKLIHSERILEIVEVCELGIETFGDPDKFHDWCLDGMPALNNIPPIDLIRDSYGKELVIGELHAINHGVFA
ncbi:type II RES/Xre toxin-antitoxin system antitoxin [Nonlabens antarcticus]|uniref:type II RES/Xre toxin-antitoxin system antitoxin n=1 Tax=Nonlabens antarcticus TaxID=392714 RepID=UPI001891ADB3|nr:antitoxin Xre-like helix-turn-helix domain-containing protein [Nonlabens antarcticus]